MTFQNGLDTPDYTRYVSKDLLLLDVVPIANQKENNNRLCVGRGESLWWKGLYLECSFLVVVKAATYK